MKTNIQEARLQQMTWSDMHTTVGGHKKLVFKKMSIAYFFHSTLTEAYEKADNLLQNCDCQKETEVSYKGFGIFEWKDL